VSTPEQNKLQVGGNTSCVELDTGSRRIILDAGTGIRLLGKSVAKDIIAGKTRDITLFLSHTHWDHIQGFPVFAPAFLSDANIHVYGPAKANRKLEQLFSGQLAYDYWPVKLNHFPAKIHFTELKEGTHHFPDGLAVTARRHIHPGVAFGYRFEYEGKSLVYCTDVEHFQNHLDERVIDLASNADLLIHDAQYDENELDSRLGWGHSTWKQAVDVALAAKAKRVALFHMDPDRNDENCARMEKDAQAIFPGAFMAREGLTVEL
jgi:phosphoribosyl 1,2-cyclic phosphodiesterase